MEERDVVLSFALTWLTDRVYEQFGTLRLKMISLRACMKTLVILIDFISDQVHGMNVAKVVGVAVVVNKFPQSWP